MKSRFEEDAAITAGKSGQFDVLVDGKLIFSKSAMGRFPVDDEVEEIFEALKDGKEPPPAPPKQPGLVSRVVSKLRG